MALVWFFFTNAGGEGGRLDDAVEVRLGAWGGGSEGGGTAMMWTMYVWTVCLVTCFFGLWPMASCFGVSFRASAPCVSIYVSSRRPLAALLTGGIEFEFDFACRFFLLFVMVFVFC